MSRAIKVLIKPLSINRCFLRKKVKTKEYRLYEEELMDLLPNNVRIPKGDKMIYIRWGFSSALADWDNPIKPFQDILQQKYNFNDREIHFAIVEKVRVPKGEEYALFKIKKLTTKDRIIRIIKELFG